MKRDAFVVDVDGTIALHQDARDPYDWRRANSDVPNNAVVTVVRALDRHGLAIVYISGRPESARKLTTEWINRHVGVKGDLYLRADDDQRKDAIIKRELYESLIAPIFEVVGVLDDRQQVVDMWRDELGLHCFQVAAGNF